MALKVVLVVGVSALNLCLQFILFCFQFMLFGEAQDNFLTDYNKHKDSGGSIRIICSSRSTNTTL